MNDLSKTIDIDKSSLISLKAELLRKKDEVKSKKQNDSIFVAKKIPKIPKETPTATAEPKKKEHEDPEENYMLKKSKEMLEKKSKFYEHMSKTATSENENYLVRFEEKNRESRVESSGESEEEIGPIPTSSNYTSPLGDREVEYTDCLGRCFW